MHLNERAISRVTVNLHLIIRGTNISERESSNSEKDILVCVVTLNEGPLTAFTEA
jgi:hypothetical protein